MENTALVYVGSTYQTKNNLEKTILEYLQIQDRKLLKGNEIEAFKNTLLENIKGFNEKYSRCKPVRASWSPNYKENLPVDCTLFLGGSGICNFYIYQINS
jgi:hypothetical protein